MGVHKITEDFEKKLAEYTGAPYAVAVDNCSNALFLALMAVGVQGTTIEIPSHTYPSVPCEIIHAGAKVKFLPVKDGSITGSYQLKPSPVWDSALSFTRDMYKKGALMCLSFTGPYKIFKLSKGGAILTDDYRTYLWLKRARYSGRRACSYHEDNFDMMGWNFYMMPELAARGLLLISQFYDSKGSKTHQEDLTMEYPDLSKFKIYTEG